MPCILFILFDSFEHEENFITVENNERHLHFIQRDIRD